METDNDDLIAEKQDALLNDATHAAADVFEEGGIILTTDELYRLNDLLDRTTQWTSTTINHDPRESKP